MIQNIIWSYFLYALATDGILHVYTQLAIYIARVQGVPTFLNVSPKNTEKHEISTTLVLSKRINCYRGSVPGKPVVTPPGAQRPLRTERMKA